MPTLVNATELPYTITANGDYLIDVLGPLGTVGNFNTLYFVGTWGSGTIKVQLTPDKGTNNFDFSGNTLTADGYVSMLAKSQGININLAGATSPSIKVYVF